MLGARWRRLLIFHIFIMFAANVSTVNAKTNTKVHSKGTSKVLGQINYKKIKQERAGDKPSNQEDVFRKIDEDTPEDTLVNSEDVAGPNSNDLNEDTSEELKNFKLQSPLVKYKDKANASFVLTPEQMHKFKIWDDGVIPYYIDVVSYSDKVFRDMIRDSLQKTNSVVGVSFVELPSPPTNDDERWVFFVNRRGILGSADHTVKNFTKRGVQQVILGYDCFADKGELAEAVMSIVGVPAQHNAPDRDDYVIVNTESIKPDKRYLFDKLGDDQWLFGNLGYDFESITHYDMHKYSVDGHATIVPKDESKNINPGRSFSSTDIIKIKMLYTEIMKKQHLHESDCKKLFQPRGRFERYSAISHKPSNIKLTDSQLNSDEEVAGDRDTQKLNMNSDRKIKENKDKLAGSPFIDVIAALSDYVESS